VNARFSGVRILLVSVYVLVSVGVAGEVLAGLKGDDVIEWPWALALVPVWIELTLVMALSLFLCPGFLDQTIGMHR
jgi:hypothetical protein